MKKIFIIILIVLIFLGYYFIIEKDILELEENRIMIQDLESLNIELLREKIYHDNGIISFSDKSIKNTNYNGDTEWSKEVSDFIYKVFYFDNIFVITENKNKILEININGNIIEEYNFESQILYIEKSKDIFAILKTDNVNKAVKIANGNIEEITVDGNIICLTPMDDIDSYFIGYFYLASEGINSVIEQRLIKGDIKRWEATLEGELLVEAKQISSRNFVLTGKNFYTFNTDGIILWKYNNFENIVDFIIDENNKRILLLEKEKLHIIKFDSSVEKIIELDDTYDKITIHDNNILIGNNNKISLIGEEIYSIWPINEKIMSYSIVENNIYVETDFSFYKGTIK
ncbi:MAG: hypothetical protein R6U59_04880 [Eubacteriales bacterium]